MQGEVVIIKTGVANVASVIAACKRCGIDAAVTSDAGRVRDAAAAVLPGVGSFGAGMAELRAHALDRAVTDRVESASPTLAVCLGLHLLCKTSEETPGETGLGLLDADVRRFPHGVAAPQFGWNHVKPDAGCELVTPGYAYFANSFRVVPAESDLAAGGWSHSETDHGGPFASTLERGPVLACQFHPELSGPWGLALLRRWLASAGIPLPNAEGAAAC